jgi:isocitrate dehydrogenase
MSRVFPLPSRGEPITRGADGHLNVPNEPIVPFIEGDGTGPDIWRASVRVLDAAVAKAYGGTKKIAWHEVYAGEKAKKQFDSWLPEETVEDFKNYLVGIKGPAHHPGGQGHPLAQRGPAADARPVRVPAPRAVVPGRALAREGPAEGRHGDLP